jgi:hypothetical protein
MKRSGVPYNFNIKINNRMKTQINNIINKTILFVLILTFYSCGEDFLTQYPENKIVDVNFYETDADFEAAINGVYDSHIWYQRCEFFPMQDMCTPFANGGSGRYGQYKMGRIALDASYRMAAEWWEIHYLAIFRANVVLANADKQDSEVSDAIRNRVKGEAYFLRAFSYYTLAYLYSDVPLITEPQKYEDLLVERNPKSEIIEQAISDLKQAETLLPSVTTYRGTKNLGRASKGAAKSLLGKIYLYEKRYKEASDKLLEVISSGDYELVSNFPDMFWPSGENGIESIFEFQYEIDDPDQNANFYVNFCTTSNESNIAYTNGNNYIQPTQNYIDRFETVNGYTVSSTFIRRDPGAPNPVFVFNYDSDDPDFDPSNSFDNRDPRLKWTVWYENTPYIKEFEQRTGQENVNYKSSYTTESNHNTVKYITGRLDKQNNSSMNLIAIRLADVYLLYAEAQIQQNNLTEAITYINKVRKRPSVNMPTVEEVSIIQNLNLTNNKDNLLKYLQQERYRELAFEYGHMYHDMVRWDVLAEETVNHWTENKEGFGNPALTEFKKEWYLFPIPNAERLRNPNLTQNPGYN